MQPGGLSRGAHLRTKLHGFLEPENWALVAYGFLAGRAAVSALMPFGLAFLAMVKAARGHKAPLAAGAVLLGIWSFSPGREELVVKVVQAVLLYLSLASYGVQAAKERRVKIATTVLFLVAGVKAGAVIIQRQAAYHLLVTGFEALLAAVLTVVYLGAFPVLLENRRHRPITQEEAISLVFLLGAALPGLAGLNPAGLSLMDLLGYWLVMMAGLAGGAPAGAAVGVASGLLVALAGSGPPLEISTYALSGLLAGTFRDLGKPGCGTGFVLGQVILSVYLQDMEAWKSTLGSAGASLLLLALTPGSWLQVAAGWFVPGGDHRQEATRRKEAERQEATTRLKELAGVFQELSRTFEQAPGAEREASPASLPEVVRDVTSRVCENCSVYASCWEKDFYRTYKQIFDLLTLAEIHGQIFPSRVREEMRRRCIHLGELVTTINYLLDVYRLNRGWHQRLAENRQVVSRQLRGVASIMKDLAEDIGGEGMLAGRRLPPTLEYRTGVARVARNGATVSGDSYLVKECRNKLVLLLSDGMGIGPRASLESQATITLLEQLIESGFDRRLAVRTVNSILLLRSPDEVFATVDLAVVDLVTGDAEFIKIGSAPTFLVRGDQVSVLVNASVPAGILNNIDIEAITRSLQAGDLVVMVTDGVLESRKGLAKKDEWLASFLRRARQREPQELAQAILDKAIAGSSQEVPDDMTVLVAKLVARP